MKTTAKSALVAMAGVTIISYVVLKIQAVAIRAGRSASALPAKYAVRMKPLAASRRKTTSSAPKHRAAVVPAIMPMEMDVSRFGAGFNA